MDDRSQSPSLETLWRRRWLIVVCVVLATAAAAVISTALPKVYSTSSKLLVVQTRHNESFDAIQAAQVTARTYSNVLSSANIARLVSQRLPTRMTASQVAGAVSIEPIAETQLLQIHADADTPTLAKALADTYAQVFVQYAHDRLQPTTGATVTLADAAPLTGAPSRPRPKLYMLLAFFLAIPLSVGLAFLRDRIDSRLRSVEELEELLKMPVIARIPQRRRDTAGMAAFDEAFRMLRASLRYSANGGVRTIAVTSAWEGEGKTTVTLNLGVAAAEAGQRVLLVEGDLYRADLLHQLEPVSDPTLPGLADYLTDAVEIDDIVYRTSTPNLRIIPAGHSTGNPSFSALLESERGQALFAHTRHLADLVIFDCPPLGPRADAAVIAVGAEGVLLVADLQVATKHRVHRALLQLRSVNALLVGTVVNRDRSAHPGHYDYAPRADLPEAPLDPAHSERG